MHKYKFLDVIGQGEFGTVFKCQRVKSDDFVAIKEFKKGANGTAQVDNVIFASSAKEYEILKALQHENIIGYIEAFHRKKVVYIVLEYMECNLKDVFKGLIVPLYIELISVFLYQLTRAIEFCHSKGYLHRDIKPQVINDITTRI